MMGTEISLNREGGPTCLTRADLARRLMGVEMSGRSPVESDDRCRRVELVR